MRFRAGILLIAVSWVCSPAARGATQTFSDLIAQRSTDWSDVLSVPQFDPSLGSLQAVEILAHCKLGGTAFFENLEPSAAGVELTLSSTVTFKHADNSIFLTLTPAVSIDQTPTSFDGQLDFSGTSGGTFGSLSDERSQSASLTAPADLLAYSGLGSIDFPVSAVGNSVGIGPGNWTFGFLTSAEADIEVTYTYTPAPEPCTIALFAVGAAGLRRRS